MIDTFCILYIYTSCTRFHSYDLFFEKNQSFSTYNTSLFFSSKSKVGWSSIKNSFPPSQKKKRKKKKRKYFDPKKNKIGITRSVSKYISTDGILIDNENDARNGNLRLSLVLILAHHYYFVNVFIPRMVDKAALEARSCFFACFLVTFLWYPPADSANSDSDHSLFLSRRFSHSHHPPSYCSPVPLVAPFYFFSISFDDFETRFSPKFTYTHIYIYTRVLMQDLNIIYRCKDTILIKYNINYQLKMTLEWILKEREGRRCCEFSKVITENRRTQIEFFPYARRY